MSRSQRLALAILLPVVVVGALLVGRSLRPEPSSSLQLTDAGDATTFEYDYVIPSGTADLIDAGATVEIVPQELRVRVGEAIRIVNEDDTGHSVGLFWVGAGETLTQAFVTAGELSGECSVHSSGAFTLIVEA